MFKKVLGLTVGTAYFQLLKPLLSFKSHRITVLIAQNVAKAFLIDLSAYKLACRTNQNKPPAMDSRVAGAMKSRRIGTFIKRQ